MTLQFVSQQYQKRYFHAFLECDGVLKGPNGIICYANVQNGHMKVIFSCSF